MLDGLGPGKIAPALRRGPDADSSESGAAGDYPYALEARVGLYVGWLGIILVALPWAFSLVTACCVSVADLLLHNFEQHSELTASAGAAQQVVQNAAETLSTALRAADPVDDDWEAALVPPLRLLVQERLPLLSKVIPTPSHVLDRISPILTPGVRNAWEGGLLFARRGRCGGGARAAARRR